jgi:hypothetical protein
MKLRKYVTVKIEYDTEEVWETTQQDISDLMDMMNNITRRITIIEIAEE